MNRWYVSRLVMMVTDRGMIWGRSCARSRFASAAASSTSRQWSGSSKSWATVNVTGRPLAARRHQQRQFVDGLGPLAAEPLERADGPGHDGLEHAVTGRAEGAGEGQDLLLGGVGPGYRPAGSGLVADGA